MNNKLFWKVAIWTNIIIASFVFTSCSSDNGDKDESHSDYSFSFKVLAYSSNQKTTLSSPYDKDVVYYYYKDDIIVKSLQETDLVELDITQATDHFADLKIDITSHGPDGIATHNIVIEWKYNNTMTRDSIVCEIEKSENNILVKNIWVNNVLNYTSSMEKEQPIISITKVSPEVLEVYDINNNVSRIEKEVDSLIYVFWLSDVEGKETNIFSEQDVKDKGFMMNFSLTNNSKYTVYKLGTFWSSLGFVFDGEHRNKLHSCNTFSSNMNIADTYDIDLNPGKTFFYSQNWCPYNENEPTVNLLPAGKYYTYYYEGFLVFKDYVPAIDWSPYYQYTPIMTLHFEVK